MKKNIICVFIIIILILFLTLNSFAATFDPVNIGDFTGETTTTSENVSSALGKALSIIQIIGVGVAVIMLIVLAIKYMVSSVSDRAEIKKHAVVYVVGAIIMFGTAGILELIKGFTEDALN